MKEFFACLSPDPLCIQESNEEVSEEIQCMIEKYLQIVANELER
jgi:hypothetical protein